MHYTFYKLSDEIPDKFKMKTNVFILKDDGVHDTVKLSRFINQFNNKNIILILYTSNIEVLNIINPKYIIIDSNIKDVENIIISSLLINCIPIFIDNNIYNKYKYLSRSSLNIDISIEYLEKNCSYNANLGKSFNINNHLNDKIASYISRNLPICSIGGTDNYSKEIEPLLMYTFESVVDILKKDIPRIPQDFIYLYPMDYTYIVERGLMRKDEKVFTKEDDGYIHIRYRQENRLDNETLTPRLLPKNGILGLFRIRDNYSSFPVSEEQMLYQVKSFFKELFIKNGLDPNNLTNTGVDLYYDDFKFLSGEYFVDKGCHGGTILIFFIYMEFDSLKHIFKKYCSDSKHKYKGLSEIVKGLNRETVMKDLMEFMIGEYF